MILQCLLITLSLMWRRIIKQLCLYLICIIMWLRRAPRAGRRCAPRCRGRGPGSRQGRLGAPSAGLRRRLGAGEKPPDLGFHPSGGDHGPSTRNHRPSLPGGEGAPAAPSREDKETAAEPGLSHLTCGEGRQPEERVPGRWVLWDIRAGPGGAILLPWASPLRGPAWHSQCPW